MKDGLVGANGVVRSDRSEENMELIGNQLPALGTFTKT